MADRYSSLKQGLVGAWIPSVSGSGLLLPDLSGRGNNGVLTNMGPNDWVSSQYGRSLDFDGSNDYVTSGNMSNAGAFLDLTVSCFVNVTSSTAYFPFVEKYQGLVNGFLLYGVAGSGYGFDGRESGALYITSGYSGAGDIQIGSWVHLVGRKSGTTWSIWVNGVLKNSQTVGTGTTSVNNTTRPLLIGGSTIDAVYTAGLIDDVRIYNRALSESEIRLLASEPGIGFKPAKKLSRFSQRFTYKPPKARTYGLIRNRDADTSSLKQGLVGAWCPSISGQGNVLPDLIGGNHGTLTNMDASDWVSSEYGRALDFDGVNDLVSFATIPALNTIASQSFWFRRGGVSQHCPGMGFGVIGSSANRFVVQVWNDGVIYVSFGGSNWGSFASNDLNWHHIAVVYDGSQSSNSTRLRAWFDGSEVSLSYTGTIPATIGSYTTMRIGQTFAGAAAGADPYGIGWFDSALIHNRVILPAEIRLLATRRGIGLEPRKPKLLFHQFPSGSSRRLLLTGQT